MVAAPLHLLLAAEHLLDAGDAIDDEQVFPVGWQATIAQAGKQLLNRRRVFRGPGGNPQSVLVAFHIHAYRTENVMFSEPLAVDVDHSRRLVPFGSRF